MPEIKLEYLRVKDEPRCYACGELIEIQDKFFVRINLGELAYNFDTDCYIHLLTTLHALAEKFIFKQIIIKELVN